MDRGSFIKSIFLGGGALFTHPIQKGKGFPFLLKSNLNKEYRTDILIYGGTSAAVTAAVCAKKLGKSVMVVSPDKHLGGMTSNGLGFTDSGHVDAIGGLSGEFYHRIYLHYQKKEAWNWQKKEAFTGTGQGTSAIDKASETMWVFEPHAAEAVFDDFVQEHNIQVFRDEWLDRARGVAMKDGKIEAIKTLSGKTFKAKMFIDATYEGDLMAAAGVRYYVGREPNSLYHEEWNGVETGVFQHAHHFKHDINPFKVPGDPRSGLLSRISPGPPGLKGEGDQKIQAYCFRMCLTNHPANRVPFPQPEGYDPDQYELLVRIFKSGWDELFHKFDSIPNKKTDTNNHGPFSTDNIGMNYGYPNGSYDLRKRIIREHETYQKGLMYFMATDPRIPRDLQDKLNSWGLAGDEFTDHGNWPSQLYIREARRMIGKFVMTEHEVLGKNPVDDPVGMGSYALDSHNTQRYVKQDGYVQNEGDIGVRAPKPYGISYNALIPEEEECTNLLVPVCASCSHTAYGSIRMEPVFMILGESVATAASLAIEEKAAVQKIDYAPLKAQLLKQGQVLSL